MDSGFTPYDPNGPGQEGDESRGPRLRDISLRMMVPNIITALAICAGMTGIRLAFEGRYQRKANDYNWCTKLKRSIL